MTVVNVMKFNRNRGGIVADAQGSSGVKKYDTFRKVDPWEVNGYYGFIAGAGGAYLAQEIRKGFSKYLDKVKYPSPVESVARSSSKISLEVKNDAIESFMRKELGFGIKTFQTGKLDSGEPVSPEVLKVASEIYSCRPAPLMNISESVILVIGQDDKRNLKIYGFETGDIPQECVLPYASIGSGSDESKKVLHGFHHNLPRSNREDIDFISGMAALIQATNNSADLSLGVGGIPTIAYFDKTGTHFLGERESLLASELVRIREADLIDRKKTRKALTDLLLQREDFEKVEKEALKNNPKWERIQRFLRGYRTSNSLI